MVRKVKFRNLNTKKMIFYRLHIHMLCLGFQNNIKFVIYFVLINDSFSQDSVFIFLNPENPIHLL